MAEGSTTSDRRDFLRRATHRWIQVGWQGPDLSAFDDLHAPDFVDHSPSGREGTLAGTRWDTRTPLWFGSVAPTFAVADVTATVRWYERHLGFTSYPFPRQEPYVFASLCRDGVEIMLMRVRGYSKPDVAALRPEG